MLGEETPRVTRAVEAIISPALRAAAKQRSRADGGLASACAELLEKAGRDQAERWLTAALLADIENEIATLPAAKPPPPRSSFAAREAERDVEEAQSFGVYGIVAGLVFGAVINYVVVSNGWYPGGGGGGGEAGGLEAALDLLS